MNHYKVEIGSPLGLKIAETFEQIKRCNSLSIDIMKEVGAQAINVGSFSKGGGIWCFQFENPPEEKYWKRKGSGWYPKNLGKMKELVTRIETLPTVSVIDWADLFKSPLEYQPGCFRASTHFFINSKIALELPDAIGINMSEWALAKESITPQKAPMPS